MHPKIQHIIELWYLSKGALFQIFGTHNLVENSKINSPFRCGRGIIEYNEEIIRDIQLLHRNSDHLYALRAQL